MHEYADSHMLQLAQFNTLLATNPGLADTISRAVACDQRKPAELGENGVRSICETLRQVHSEPATDGRGFSEVSSSTGCNCRSFSRTEQYEPLSILHFRKVFRRRHFSTCPRYKTSEDSLECVMRIVPPKWLLSHTIHLGFCMRMRAVSHAFSIAPIILGASRIIDKSVSPAFQLLENFESNLRHDDTSDRPSAFTHPGPGIVTTLENTLRDLFDSGLSSPADEDATGDTILYVRPVYSISGKVPSLTWCQAVLSLYLKLGTRDHYHYKTEVWDNNAEFLSLISFLLEKGSNPNVLCLATHHSPWVTTGPCCGTSLDMFANDLSFPDRLWWRPRSGALVRDKIASEGGEFSRDLTTTEYLHPYRQCEHFAWELAQLYLFPEQFER